MAPPGLDDLIAGTGNSLTIDSIEGGMAAVCRGVGPVPGDSR